MADAKAIFDAAPEAGAQDAKALFDAAPEAEHHAANASDEAFRDEGIGKFVEGSIDAGLRGAQKVLSIGHRVGGAAAGLEAMYHGKDFGPAYDAYRQEAAQKDAAAAENHPVASVVGEMAPGLAVPGGAFSTLGRAVLTGGALGAAQTAADTPDLEAPGAVRRVGRGALTGAGLGAVGAGAPAVAGPLADKLEEAAIKSGRRVLTGGGTPMNATREPLTPAAVKAALDHGAIVPGGTTAGAAKRLIATRETLGSQYEKIIDALRARGIEGPQADALAQEMIAEGRSISANSLTDAVPDLYQRTGESLQTKPTLPSGNLDLKQAENMKRSLQREAKYGRYEDTPLNEGKEDLAAMVRKANEDAIDAGAAASGDAQTQAIAAQFKPIKEDLGNIIAASRAANKGAGKAAVARGVSLTDYAAAAAGFAHGGAGEGSKLAILNHLARTRGPSTMSWAAHAASDKIAAIAKLNPAALGKYGAVLGAALQKGDSEYNAHYFVLGQTDPEFRSLTEKLANEGHE